MLYINNVTECLNKACMLYINNLTAYKSVGWKTWWWPMLAETCSFYHLLININFYTLLCYWL